MVRAAANGSTVWKWASGLLGALLLAALGGMGAMLNHASNEGHPALSARMVGVERQHQRDIDGLERELSQLRQQMDRANDKLDTVLKELRNR